MTAESSTLQLTSALAPLPIWLSSLRPLVVSYGDVAATLFADGARPVRRLEDSSDVEPGDAGIAYSHAELASDTCPSETTHGLLHRLAIHLDPAALPSPSSHLPFECRIVVRGSKQSLWVYRAAEDLSALVLVVLTTIILACLDDDPDAVLADGRIITSSSAYICLAAIDADSTGVELIAALDSIAARHSRDYYQSGRQAEREERDGSDDESMDEPGSSSSSASVSRSSCSSSSSSCPTVAVTVVLIIASVGRSGRLPRTDVQ